MTNLVDLLKALLLGIVEGLTEFIPVSSTAHLMISSYLIDFQSIKNNLFEIVIQLGAILAVCIIYRQKIFSVISNLRKKNNQKFVFNLLLAFLPALIIGGLFHKIIKAIFFSNLVIAIALIVGGIIMIAVETKPKTNVKKIENIDEIAPIQAFYIGLFQCLAMIPGTSRSGATIIGALLLKLNRKVAAEFSFFLAIPTIFAATILDLIENFHQLTTSNLELILIGTLAAFLSAILVIKWFVAFISKNNFIPFGIYRIIAGTFILIFII
ncbi:MAG: undecaprenyl-diphosphate phosphatase [Rickettsiales bacterium]|nr:undecaprenyl-diphosphate phosphatase [Rickettsiales bacterium]